MIALTSLLCVLGLFEGTLVSGERYTDIVGKLGAPLYTEYGTTWEGGNLRRFPHWCTWRFVKSDAAPETTEVYLEFEAEWDAERLCSFTDHDLGFVIVFHKQGRFLGIDPAQMKRWWDVAWLGEIRRSKDGVWLAKCLGDKGSSWRSLSAGFDNYLAGREEARTKEKPASLSVQDTSPKEGPKATADTGKYRVVVLANDKELGDKVLSALRDAGFTGEPSRVFGRADDAASMKYCAATKEDVKAMIKLVSGLYKGKLKVKEGLRSRECDVLFTLP